MRKRITNEIGMVLFQLVILLGFLIFPEDIKEGAPLYLIISFIVGVVLPFAIGMPKLFMAVFTSFIGFSIWGTLVPIHLGAVIFMVYWLHLIAVSKFKRPCDECEINDVCERPDLLMLRCALEVRRKR